MKVLRLVMLLAAVPVCYLVFYHPESASQSIPGHAKTVDSALPTNGETTSSQGQPTPAAHSQYKRDMDQAQEAAKQMQARREEAESIR